MNLPIFKDTSVIPPGMYCYEVVPDNEYVPPELLGKMGPYKLRVCPYWSADKNAPEQMWGVCSYLETSDVEIDKEGGFGLLWDMVKECGINDEYEGTDD